MKKFDANNCPLQGVNIIEASAGTGKTYNIQLLVLRILLEKGIPLQKILVVTFTVFATGELISRLHSILMLADYAMELCSKDTSAIGKKEFDQIRTIIERTFINADDKQKARTRELIRTALRDFDQAAVMTIHGFCQRMLVDNAFYSKINFGIELKKDISLLQQRIADDFIRMIRYSDDDFSLNQKLPQNIDGSMLLDKLSLAISNADSGTEPLWADDNTDGSWQELLTRLDSLDTLIKTDGLLTNEAESILGECFCKYYSEQLEKYKASENFFTFDDLIRKMANIVTQQETGESFRQAVLQNFSYVFVDEFQDTDPLQFTIFSTIFGGSDPDRGFFMIGDPKQAIYSFRGGDLDAYNKAVKTVTENNRYTLSKNYRSSKEYIDELNNFFSVKGILPVPYIEFGGTENCTLYQYGKTAKNLLSFYETATNQICDATISQISELLSEESNYAIYDKATKVSRKVLPSDIAVLFPTKAKGMEIEKALNQIGIDTIWLSDSNIFKKNEALALCEIMQMLYDGCSISAISTILTGDIFQCTATELHRLLAEKDSGESCAEAAQIYFLELRRLWERKGFYAVFRKLLFAPNREGRQWLTDIRENINGRFEENSSLAQHLIHIDFINGRYALGRLRQLVEILHQTEQEYQFTPGGLLKFMKNSIADGNNDEAIKELATIQRSTDLPAVRMMTMHASKGLQFPIVLIPFFVTQPIKSSPRLFHQKDTRMLDMSGWFNSKNRNKKSKDLCDDEFLDEKIRLLYVGVTRAKFFCSLIYSNSSQGVYNKLRKLLPTAKTFDDENKKLFSPTLPDYETSEVRTFTGNTINDWNLVSFSGFTRSYHGQTPFKPTDVYGGTDENIIDSDEENTCDISTAKKVLLPGDDIQQTIFSFGAGTAMGTVWHEIFETMHFAPAEVSTDGVFRDEEVAALIGAIKNPSLYSGIKNNRNEDDPDVLRDTAFARMLKGILFNPMGMLHIPDTERFQLSQIAEKRRLSELKFMFVLKENVSLPQIKSCLEKYGIFTGSWANYAEAVYRDHAMIGFIDLLCQSPSGKYYIIDWKSNRLDGELASFDQIGMQSEVDRNLYSLQYLIYTVALWHFLKERQLLELTEENYRQYFGGVLYLFVRGIAAPLTAMTDTEKNICQRRGIFCDLPPFELIKELKSLLDIRSATGYEQIQQGEKNAD